MYGSNIYISKWIAKNHVSNLPGLKINPKKSHSHKYRWEFY